MKRTFRFLMKSVLAIVILISTGIYAHATDYYWNGGTGSWDNPSNWTLNSVPPQSPWPNLDRVIITNAPNVNATAYFSGVANTGHVSVYGTDEGTMTLSVSAGSFYHLGVLTVGNNGVVYQAGGSIANKAMSVGAGGTYNLEAGTLRFLEEALMVYGVVNQTGGSVDSTDPLWVYQGGVYNLSGTGTTYHNYGLVAGTFNQQGGTATFQGRLGLSVGGTYNLSGGSLKAGFGGDDSIINNGTLNYSGGELRGSMSVASGLENNGTTNLSGSGTRIINGSVINNGTFSIAYDTTGMINGKYTQSGAGLLSLNLFDSTRFGRLITGDAYLDGILNVMLIPGGDIDENETFLIMSYLNRYGIFSAINLPDPDGSGPLYFDYTYLTDGILLTVKSVPEPATMLLLGLGLMGVAWIRRNMS